MVLQGIFLYLLGWIAGGYTCVTIYKTHIKNKEKAKKAFETRQKKIQALYPKKYGEMD